MSAGRDKEDARTRLDLRGLKCPLPALFARRALERASPGAEIEVLADDPMARIDVPHMCRQDGYGVDAVIREEWGARMRLRRPAAVGDTVKPEGRGDGGGETESPSG